MDMKALTPNEIRALFLLHFSAQILKMPEDAQETIAEIVSCPDTTAIRLMLRRCGLIPAQRPFNINAL